jgi:hypothetical protein
MTVARGTVSRAIVITGQSPPRRGKALAIIDQRHMHAPHTGVARRSTIPTPTTEHTDRRHQTALRPFHGSLPSRSRLSRDIFFCD